MKVVVRPLPMRFGGPPIAIAAGGPGPIANRNGGSAPNRSCLFPYLSYGEALSL